MDRGATYPNRYDGWIDAPGQIREPETKLTTTDSVTTARSTLLRLPPTALLDVAPQESFPPLPIRLDDTSAAAIAAEYYGAPDLATLLISTEDGGVRLWPELLTPRHRAAYERTVQAQIDAAEHAVAHAQPVREAMQAALLEALRGLHHPDGRRELLSRLTDRLGYSALGALTASEQARSPEVLVELLRAEDQYGVRDPEVTAVAAARLLDWVESGTAEASAHIRAVMTAVSGRTQAELLSKVSRAHQQMSSRSFARFGEPTPLHMVARFFEALSAPDRSAVLGSLREHGLLGEPAVEALMAGRSTAGRVAPMLTWFADNAASDYARWANEGSTSAYLGGALAAAATPETASDTVTALASMGLGAGLAQAFPRIAAALGVLQTPAAAYFAARDLNAALTNRDPTTGAPLALPDRVGRIITGTTGVLVAAGGATVAFRHGRMMLRPRMTPREVIELHRTHERVPLGGDGYPEVWVPKGSVGRRPGPPPSRPTGPATLAPGAASADEAANAAASVAGSKSTELMARHQFGLRHDAARAALVEQARRLGAASYLTARAAGRNHRQAMKASGQDVKKALRPTVERLAHEAVQLEVQTRIQDGTIFDRANMDPNAVTVLDAYRAGTVGQATRALARRLGKASMQDVRQIMDAEVAAGRATRRDVKLGAPRPQTMTIWETTDGGVVRLKPKGDLLRARTISVEMKVDPQLPDSGQDSIAFKLDRRGNPVPRSGHQAAPPTPLGAHQAEWSLKLLMDLGHWSM